MQVISNYTVKNQIFSFIQLVLSFRLVVSNFRMHQNHLEGLLKHRCLGPILRASDSIVQRQAQEFAFPTISQMILLHIWGPVFKIIVRLFTWNSIVKIFTWSCIEVDKSNSIDIFMASKTYFWKSSYKLIQLYIAKWFFSTWDLGSYQLSE